MISPIHRFIRKIPIWYDENKTIKQMANDGNVTYNTARSYMKEFRLPHVDARIGATHRRRKPIPPSWYDPNLTIDEMAKNSGRSYRATHIQLQRLAKRGLVLPYKRNTHDQVVAKFIQVSNENRRRARLRCDEEIARARKEEVR